MRTDLNNNELWLLEFINDCASGRCHPPRAYTIREVVILQKAPLLRLLADGMVIKRPGENPAIVDIYPTDDGLFMLRLHGVI
jgi:hypothetical protein